MFVLNKNGVIRLYREVIRKKIWIFYYIFGFMKNLIVICIFIWLFNIYIEILWINL